MPAVFFFLIDVSMNAVQTGAVAAACSAINRALSDLPVSFGNYQPDIIAFVSQEEVGKVRKARMFEVIR